MKHIGWCLSQLQTKHVPRRLDRRGQKAYQLFITSCLVSPVFGFRLCLARASLLSSYSFCFVLGFQKMFDLYFLSSFFFFSNEFWVRIVVDKVELLLHQAIK